MNESRTSLIPTIRRAREYRLYDLAGRRYLDLFQEGGRALLGHRPSRVVLAMKNTMSKGPLAAYPSVYERRLERALRLLIPACAGFRWYTSFERALSAAALHLGRAVSRILPVDPALDAGSRPDVALWRPFLSLDGEPPAVQFPVLPLPGAHAAVVVAFAEQPGDSVPQCDILSPVLLSGLQSSVHALRRHIDELDRRTWEAFDSPQWERRGPYLVARCAEGEYTDLFRSYLAAGMLVSPSFPGPSIVPAVFSAGEAAAFRRLA